MCPATLLETHTRTTKQLFTAIVSYRKARSTPSLAHSKMKAFTIVLALAILGVANAQNCPISPDKQDLDFSAVATACKDTASICSACTCALVDVYRPALIAGGIMYDPANPASFPLEETASIIRACSEQYIASMLMANIDVQTLSGLSSCTYTPDNVPSCLAPAVAAIAARNATGNMTVIATSREADGAVPAGTTQLRVATVSKQGDVVLMTLAGQMSSAAQLLQTMVASPELMSALTPAAASQLQTLATNGANIDLNPNTSAALAALANPIDAVALINTMQQLSAAAPVVAPVAAPAPAPAAKSGALSTSPVLAAVASILLAAALL